MRKLTLSLIGGAAVATLAFAGIANSQSAQPRAIDANGDGNVTRAEATAAVQARFARADANNDGRLTREDRQVAREERSARMFARIDSNNDGSISRTEWDAGASQMRERAHAMRAEHGGTERGARAEAGGHGRRGERGMHNRGDRAMRMLQNIDGNRDQAIDQSEFVAAAMTRFAALDADNDGVITAAERDAHRAQMRQRMRERRAMRAPDADAVPAPPAQ